MTRRRNGLQARDRLSHASRDCGHSSCRRDLLSRFCSRSSLWLGPSPLFTYVANVSGCVRELLTAPFLFPESLVCDTLDLSGQGLKKLSRCPSDADISTLIIDDNDLQRLDNLDSYNRITKVTELLK